MKKILLIPVFCYVLTISFVNGQQIDPSIISQLSPDQIEKVKEAYSNLNSSETTTLETPEINESLEKVSIDDSNDIENKKFGYNFFSTMPTSTTAVGDLPLPNDYKISIKDQFTVILSGSKESIFDLDVKLDGTILFPEIGSISVAGETYGQIKEKLSNLINQSYIGVRIDLSIKNLSAKKITIVGAVKTPGTYLVNPFSTISSALAYSGGISQKGTLRNIKLMRNNGKIFTFDLYNLLINADRSDDITIEAGDTILIGAASQFINLNGSVNRPGIYEVKESETIKDLINFGLGFTQTSNKSKISVFTLDLQDKKINQKETADLSLSLLNVTDIKVYDYLSESNSNILVSGAVAEPGYYNLVEFPTLGDLIDRLEFVDVYPWLGVLEQFNKDELITETILFSLVDESTYNSIKILPNSKVFFTNLSNNDFSSDFSSLSVLSNKAVNDYRLRINYQNSDLDIPIYGKYSLISIIDYLGLDMSNVASEAVYVSPLENKVILDDYRDMQFTATKFNTVSFRSLENSVIKINVSGDIDYPGNYSLSANSSLKDLYSMIGNFKETAFLDGIIFNRVSVKDRQLKSIEDARVTLSDSILENLQSDQIQNIDPFILSTLNQDIDSEGLGRVTGNFRPDNNEIKDLVLYDGDSLFIPRKSNTVVVVGEVLNPKTFILNEKMTITDVINLSGGLTKFADKKNIYVISPNGLSRKLNKNIFANSSVNKYIQAGDTVVIPRKIILNNPLSQTIAPITQILSDLAFSAAAIDNLKNN